MAEHTEQHHTVDQHGTPVQFCDLCYNFYPTVDVLASRHTCMVACRECVKKMPNILEDMHLFRNSSYMCMCCQKECPRTNRKHIIKTIKLEFTWFAVHVCHGCVENGGAILLIHTVGRRFTPESAVCFLRDCRAYVELRKKAMLSSLAPVIDQDVLRFIGGFL